GRGGRSDRFGAFGRRCHAAHQRPGAAAPAISRRLVGLGMPVTALPILYSFRRCPYAMRARLAIAASGQHCELREVVLRDKPLALIQASPKATVPVVVLPDGAVLEQSLDIMLWALRLSDPQGWLKPEHDGLQTMLALIDECEERFKPALDRYKYPGRFTRELIPQRGESGLSSGDSDAQEVAEPGDENSQVDEVALSEWAAGHRDAGGRWLWTLEARLAEHRYLFGSRTALADMAIAPFVRQYAHVDREWFQAQPWPRL